MGRVTAKQGDTVIAIDFSTDSKHRNNWADQMTGYIGKYGIVQSEPYECNGEEWVDVSFQDGELWSYPLRPLVVMGATYDPNSFERQPLGKGILEQVTTVDTPTVVRIKKKKITVIPPNLPIVHGYQPKKKLSTTGTPLKTALDKVIDNLWDGCDRDEDNVKHTIEDILHYINRKAEVFTIECEVGTWLFVKESEVKTVILEYLMKQDEYYLGSFTWDVVKQCFKEGYDRDSAKRFYDNEEYETVGQGMKSRQASDRAVERLMLKLIEDYSLESLAGEQLAYYDQKTHKLNIGSTEYWYFNQN